MSGRSHLDPAQRAGLHRLHVAEDAPVDLQNVGQCDVTDLVHQRAVDILQGGVHAQDLVMLHDALAANSQLGLQDGSGLCQVHGVAFYTNRVVNILNISLSLHSFHNFTFLVHL